MIKFLALLKKELDLELLNKYVLGGIALYLTSSVFVCYMALSLKRQAFNGAIWVVLFWLLLLFTAVTAITKAFNQERDSRHLFYYIMVNPLQLIVAKMVYNTLLTILLALVQWVIFSLFLGQRLADDSGFFITLLVGAVSFSSILTMVSGIASKTANNGTMVAVLGFPLLIPCVMLLVKASFVALDGLDGGLATQYLLSVVGLWAISVSISLLLFPYLWKS